MPIEVEGPDGAVNEFPDGTPDAVISKAMTSVYGAPKAAPAAAPAAVPAIAGAAADAAKSVAGKAGGALSSVASTVEDYLGMGPRKAAPAYQASSDLDAQMRGQAPAQAEPPKPPPTMGEQGGGIVRGALGVLDQGARGVAEGAVGLAGLPVDAMTAVLNRDPDFMRIRAALGGGDKPIEHPFLGSDFNKGVLDQANDRTIDAANAVLPERPTGGPMLSYPQREASNLPERMAHRIGEELGGAAVPVGAGVAAAKTLGREGVKDLPAIARLFAEPAAIDPGKFVGREMMNAATAGAGAGSVNEVTRALGADEHGATHAVGDLAGALAGVGTYTLGKEALSKGLDVVRAVRGSPNFRNQVTNDEAVARIAQEAGVDPVMVGKANVADVSPIVQAIERGKRVDSAIPGYQESLADRTGNAGLAAFEYGRETAGSPVLRARTDANSKSVDNALQAAAPTGSPGAFRGALEDRRNDVLTSAQADRVAAQQRFDEAAAALQTQMQAGARGADIRAPLEEAMARARDVEHGAWAGVADGSADIRPLVDRFHNVRSGLSEAERTTFEPRELTGIPQRFIPPEAPAEAGGAATRGLEGMNPEERAMADRLLGGQQPPAPAPEAGPVNVPLHEATGLRSALTDAQREAASAGNSNKARVIGRYVDAIDTYFAEHHPNVEAYDQARAVSHDLNTRFTRPQTDVAQVLDRQSGMYRVPDSEVAGRFVRPDEGNQDSLASLVREAGTDPRARAALQDQVRADVGALGSPEAIDRYVQTHARVFEQFPELRSQIQDANALRRDAAASGRAEQEVQGRLGTPDRAGTSPVGRYLRFGDEKTENAMRGVLASPKPAEAMHELLDFAGNAPEAVEGARRTFWDILEKHSRRAGETTAGMDGTQPWMPNKLAKFLDSPTNRAVAERLYRDDPEQLQRIDQIAETLQGVDLRARGKARNSSGSAQGVAGGLSSILTPETLQSRYYAYRRGQVSGTFLATSILSVIARKSVAKAQAGAIDRLVDEALANPDFAAKLLKENNPANRAIFDRAARSYLGAHADKLTQGLDDHDAAGHGDPVAAAVMRNMLPQRTGASR